MIAIERYLLIVVGIIKKKHIVTELVIISFAGRMICRGVSHWRLYIRNCLSAKMEDISRKGILLGACRK